MKFLILLCLSLTITLQATSQHNNWFQFNPSDYYKSETLNMSGWLDKPAGKHGFLQMDSKDFIFEDSTKIKFWGVNICSNEPFSSQQKARDYVRLMTKYGINAVRFHKFTWDATDGIHSTQLTDDKWKNFDFFCSELRDNGVYYSWSHIYGHRVLPADSSRLLAYNEIKNTKFPWSHINGSTASLVNFADDLQALNIELTVNMLNHTNPLTGKRYAEDPALVFVELQNEDNIFWSAIEETLKQTPSYRKLLCTKFSKWLTAKYQSQERLLQAWNNQGLSEGESLEKQNIYPHPNHGLFSHEYEKAIKENRAVPQYIADRATFLFEQQRSFYKKFVDAIRTTGYKGLIIGSCWQAGSGITHFYNLYTDYVTGPVDRHNYFGGAGHQLKPGNFENASMLNVPGSGLLSTGLQMVADRPFQLSEWMSLIPNEWVAESAPLVATYGLGLQGWDASFSFAMDFTHYTNTIQSGHGVYNVTSPMQLALYPALAAMIYRGDVKEGKPVANRNVNIEELEKGELNFKEKAAQQYDVKHFESETPLEALAIGPVTVTFNQQGKQLKANLDDWWDKEDKTITSNTKQLQWNYQKRGYFTINSTGTKALVGFAPSEKISLGDLSLKTSNEFAVIYITSLDREKDLSSSKKILITTVARAVNTGMKFNTDTTAVVAVGDAPILLEPVNLELTFKSARKPKAYVLDQVGNKTGETIRFKNDVLYLDGRKHKTIYYLLEY